MNVRLTSIIAYKEIRYLQSDSHNMIMDMILSHPEISDWTAREIRQFIIDEGIMEKDKCLSSSISGRMNEMKKLDLIHEVGKRVCNVSGRWSIMVEPSLINYRDWQNEQIAEEQRKEMGKYLKWTNRGPKYLKREREQLTKEEEKWVEELFS